MYPYDPSEKILMIKKASLKTRAKLFQPDLKFQDGTYVGQSAKKPLLPHGYGVFVQNETGSVYEGWRRYGLRWGHGRVIQSNGFMYEGEWYNNYPHGSGFVRYPIEKGHKKGDIFYGNFKQSKREGPGFLYMELEKQAYFGAWKNDKFDGDFLVKDLHGNQRLQLYKDGQQLRDNKRSIVTLYMLKDRANLAFMLI